MFINDYRLNSYHREVRQRQPWEERPRALPRGDKDLYSGGAAYATPAPSRPIIEKAEVKKAEAPKHPATKKPEGSAWNRLLGYFFFPESLNMNSLIETGKTLLNSLGEDYGKLLTPSDAKVLPEVAQMQSMAQSMVEKVGGEALKKAGLDVRVNLYASDRADSFARVDPNGPKKSFVGKVKSLFSSEEEKPAPVEIGLTVGALKKAQTEDQLAFLVAREVAKAVSGDHAITINNLVTSQGNEVAADAKAFEMLTEAGYDPAEGLTSLEELCRNQEAGRNGLSDALSAAVSSEHHQGVRMALAQMNVENLRRTKAAAHPKSVHKALPQSTISQLPSEIVQNPLTGVIGEMAEAYATQPIVVGTDGVLAPKGDIAREKLFSKKWNAEDAGDALNSGLEKLQSLPPQEKAERGLALLQGVANVGWHKGNPPNLTEKFTEFMAGAKGWKADAFIEKLEKTESTLGAFESNAAADFTFQVLMNPKFQKAVAPLMKDDPEWQKLFEAAPKLLSISKDGTQESVHEQLSGAVGLLAGQERRELYPMYRQWPGALKPGQGPLDNILRDGMKTLMSNYQVEGRENLRDYIEKFDGALQADFVADMRGALAPSLKKLEVQRDQLIAKKDINQEEADVLFDLIDLAPINEDQQFQLLNNITTQAETLPLFKDQPFTENKSWANFLGSSLVSEKVPSQTKEKIFKSMVATLPSRGLRGHEPGAKELIAFTAQKTDMELMGHINLEIANNGIGSKLNEYGEAPTHGNPVMSLVGSDKELSTRVAKNTNLLQFDSWLGKLHGDETHRLDSGTRRFMLDTMLANQKKEADLEEWVERVNTLVDPYTLSLNPDLKPRMQEYLVPTLEKFEGAQLREKLATEPVMSILSEEQATSFLVEVLNPASMAGDDDKLRSELLNLEEQFKLGDKPTLKKSVYVEVAEQAKLQPHNIDYVLPNITEPTADMAKTLDKEIRGLSALVAAARTRPAKEQLDTVEYLMGRNADVPAYFDTMENDAFEALSAVDPRIVEELQANGATAGVLLEGLRNFLSSSDIIVRTAVAASFLAGPGGLLGNENGKDFLLDTFLAPVQDKAGDSAEVAVELIRAALKAEEKSLGAIGGYLLAQKQEEPEAGGEVKEPTMGEMLHHAFGSYTTPGHKMEQYLAFSKTFAEFEEDFAKAQDSARDMNYFDGVKLIQHHYGDNWPKNRVVQKIIGNGSVNVAVLFTDADTGENGVAPVSPDQKNDVTPYAGSNIFPADPTNVEGDDQVVQMPIPAAHVQSDYDFYRLERTISCFLENPKMKAEYGFMDGLLKVLKESVSLEFDRAAAFKMQKDVYPFYKRKVGKWNISAVPAYHLEGDAIVMGLAGGKTARKTLQRDEAVYKEAMTALGSLETDALTGIGPKGNIIPQASHANADFHDGQVLIDTEKDNVWILDFAQCVPITPEETKYALSIATIIGGVPDVKSMVDSGNVVGKSAEILSGLTDLDIPAKDLEPILEGDNEMDKFIKLVGYLANRGKPMPLSVVHWIQMLNRRRALGDKIGENFMLQAKMMGASHLLTGGVGTYNAVRQGIKTAKNVWGSLVGGVGSVLGTPEASGHN